MTPRWRRALAILGLAAAVGGLTGCPHRFDRPADGPTEATPVLAKLAARGQALHSLSGMLSLEVWRKDERVRLHQLLLFERPDRLRVDTLSPFDQPLAMMASDGQVVSIYALEQKRFQRGPATPANLARLLRLPLSGAELTALLGGGSPALPGATSRLDWDAERGEWLVTLEAGARRQRLWLEPKAWRLSEARLYEGDQLLLSARFGDYDGEGDTAVARRMRFEVPADALRVDAVFEDHAVNVTPPPDAFTVPPPSGVEIEAL